jgi:excisionase family DNA binding protein
MQLCNRMSAQYNNESLLNTAEAARFLRVSQASVRRWFDAGLLPGHRIGRRRERRFREEDLVAFLNQSTPRASGTPTVTVAGLVAQVPLHLAAFFSSDLGGLRLTVPFLTDGVRMMQPCFLVARGDAVRRYRSAMGSFDGVELVEFKAGTADAAIAQWEKLLGEVVARGSGLIRVVGEMAEERTMFATEDEMLRYEEAFELMCRRFPVAVVCQYDARVFDGTALLRALKAHPDLFGLRTGAFLN